MVLKGSRDRSPGRDSPSLKVYYLIHWLGHSLCKTLLEEKTVIVELGEFQPSLMQVDLDRMPKDLREQTCPEI